MGVRERIHISKNDVRLLALFCDHSEGIRGTGGLGWGTEGSPSFFGAQFSVLDCIRVKGTVGKMTKLCLQKND